LTIFNAVPRSSDIRSRIRIVERYYLPSGVSLQFGGRNAILLKCGRHLVEVFSDKMAYQFAFCHRDVRKFNADFS